MEGTRVTNGPLSSRPVSRKSVLRAAAGLAGAALGAAPLAVAFAGPIDMGGARPLSGRLAASSSGTTASYTFDYPGREDVWTIEMQIWPDDQVVLGAAGFAIYNPNGSLYGVAGSQRGLRPNVAANLV